MFTSSPYAKILSTKYVLNEGLAEIEKKVEINNLYVDLIIGVKDAGTYTLTWPSTLSPDNTDEFLKNAIDSNHNVSLTLAANSSYSFRFFFTAVNSPLISENDFLITK